MVEFIAYLPYYIITAPLALGLIGLIVNIILSPVIVTHQICETLVPTIDSEVTVDKFEMFSKLTKKELIEISKTTKTYNPRYKIDDPLQFGD